MIFLSFIYLLMEGSILMDLQICSKCHKEKSLSEFRWRNKSKNRRHSFCKKCHAAYRRRHYILHRDKYINKAQRWNRMQTRMLREFILKYLAVHPCVDCGNNDIRVLEFDHENNKYMNVSVMIRNCHAVESVRREIAKCSVRCANCHRIKTFTKGKFWKTRLE